MSGKVNHDARAFRAWEVLTEIARERKTITYSRLASRIGCHQRAARYFLDPIQRYCKAKPIPPLNVLAVSKATGEPGHGFNAAARENLKETMEEVFDYPWNAMPNPFQTFADGTITRESMVDRLLSAPTESEGVLRLVKDRGMAHQIFRDTLLEAYNCECAVCGFSYSFSLEAAHIIPWAECTAEQKMDPRNGILLCSIHHRMYDLGYLRIGENYVIRFRDSHDTKDHQNRYDKLMTLRFDGKKIGLPQRNMHRPEPEFLGIHESKHQVKQSQ